MNIEGALMWATLGLYAAASILAVVGVVFARPLALRSGLWAAVAGVAAHGAALGLRWARVGHGPFLGFYEVASSLSFLAVLMYAVISLRSPRMRALGLVLLPLSLLTVGAAMLADPADAPVAGKLGSWWLTIHVTFAKLAYTSFILSFALALLFLLRERGVTGRIAEVLDKLPSQLELDDLSFRFIGAGAVFQAVMLFSGAIWANEAWGRYWAWDPIETWSLIAWLVYSAYLHVRLTMGWNGRRAAWFAALAMPVVAFSLLGVPLVYQSMHGAYLQGLRWP